MFNIQPFEAHIVSVDFAIFKDLSYPLFPLLNRMCDIYREVYQEKTESSNHIYLEKDV